MLLVILYHSHWNSVWPIVSGESAFVEVSFMNEAQSQQSKSLPLEMLMNCKTTFLCTPHTALTSHSDSLVLIFICVQILCFPYEVPTSSEIREEYIHGPLFFALIFMYITKLRFELMSSTLLFSIPLTNKQQNLKYFLFSFDFLFSLSRDRGSDASWKNDQEPPPEVSMSLYTIF